MRGHGAAVQVHGVVACLLAAIGFAACGGGASRVATAGGGLEPSTQQLPSAANSGAVDSSAAPGSTSSGFPPATSPALPSSAFEMKPMVPSAMAADLSAIGLDAKNLPPIEKLEPRALRAVMKLMAKSLGVRCADCHQEGDFAAPTRRKKIAAHMWDEFAAKLTPLDARDPDGVLFCDSCHAGRLQLLDRRDKKALSQWMDDEFVAKLAFKAGRSAGSVECETCHVGMDMHFLAKWGQ